jgi:DNA modification methylase
MNVHEVCNIFPMMTDEEFSGLKEDIRVNGQREPVWTHQGSVVDGRNRLKACEELGVEPKVREWDGAGSLVEFVVSLNLHRRHLTSGQRAACGTEIEERLGDETRRRQQATAAERGRLGGEAKAARAERPSSPERIPDSQPQPPPKLKHRENESREKAAKLVGANPRYIQDAKAVKKAAPELHEKVKAGVLTLPQAKREVQRQEKRAALEAKATAAAPCSEASWEIIVGDCIEVMQGEWDDETDTEKGPVASGSARLIFADPPYNIGVEYGDHHDDCMPEDAYLEWCWQWIDAASDVLTPDGSFWLLVNHEWAWHLCSHAVNSGLALRQWLTWYESFGVNCAGKFNRCSRALLWFVKDPKRFVFNPDAVSRPSDRQLKYGDRRADPGGKLWDDVWGINPPIPRLVGNAAERIPDFPTQLPVALLLAVVGCASDPGDLVIDPFNGSGTTGEAAIRLGRRYLGIEKSARFADLARMRLKAARRDGDDEGRTQDDAHGKESA